MLTLYARKEPTKDRMIRSGARRYDVVLYRDEQCTQRRAAFAWHHAGKPKPGRTRFVTLDGTRWQLVWK